MAAAELTTLKSAYEKARLELLDRRTARGHWVGELASSALSTATAISALSLADAAAAARQPPPAQADQSAPAAHQRLVERGLAWLIAHQHDDGGWGDTDLSRSNISTTMLALAAIELAKAGDRCSEATARGRRFVEAAGGIAALRARYGRDNTFAVPILTNCALAGQVPWQEVAALPFEAACVPQRFYRFLRLPVVSYAIPALVAIGQAKFHHDPPANPLVRAWRRRCVAGSLRVLERIQPASGGYLEAVPLTSFVVMSLAAIGRHDHPVAVHGVRFLVDSVREDGSWPIDTNLATWNTTLAINALAAAGEDVSELTCLDWLLSCQHTQVHPFTGAEPGGWGWSDLSGAVPDADDTPGALLALAEIEHSRGCSPPQSVAICQAARAGAEWLLRLQNADGGWPTFCRGWGALPFDRSGADLTAHAVRALHTWRQLVGERRVRRALTRGMNYLQRVQRRDGSWTPLWFGNQDHSAEENPVYGTARVLLAYAALDSTNSPAAKRGLAWLRGAQNRDGGWGCGEPRGASARPQPSSVEETAVAIEALLAMRDTEAELERGLRWLVRAVQSDQHLRPSPIGFYFAKLWYYEALYPRIFATAALGRAVAHPELLPHTWSAGTDANAAGLESPDAAVNNSGSARSRRPDMTPRY